MLLLSNLYLNKLEELNVRGIPSDSFENQNRDDIEQSTLLMNKFVGTSNINRYSPTYRYWTRTP
jgi:hypothetical protein